MGWWHLLVKELIQLRRDWRLWPLLLGTPVFQLILFGYAVCTDIVHSRVVIADEDRTPTSRGVKLALSSYEELDVLAVVPTRQEGYARLKAGTTDVLVLIPQGWEKSAQRGEAQILPVAIDGTDAMTATAIQGYLAGAVQALSPRPAFPLHVRLRFNPNKESNFYIIPGVLAMLIGLLNTVLVALSVAKERELGTIEQLQVSPLSPGAFVAGKTVAFLLLGLLQLALILVTAQALFQLPLRGSLGALVGLSAIYISGYIAMGLIVASYCSNQQQAMLLSFFVIFPNLMITGCFFPADDMPWPIEWLSRLLPIRYYLVLLRTILLKGGSGLLPEPLAWLVGLSLLYVLWAVLQFRRLPHS